MLLLVDGDPGLIQALSGMIAGKYGAVNRPNIMAQPMSSLLTLVEEDCQSPRLTIWEGSWLSETPEKRWEYEWNIGRAIQATGLRLYINNYQEGLWAEAQEAGWCLGSLDAIIRGPEYAADWIIDRLVRATNHPRGLPPRYCGPGDAPIVVVGEKRKDLRDEGFWLPFTGATSKFGMELGFAGLRLGWTRALDIPPSALRGAKKLIAAGETADRWCRMHVGHQDVVRIPNPSWLYTFAGPEAVAQARGMVQRLMLEFEQ